MFLTVPYLFGELGHRHIPINYGVAELREDVAVLGVWALFAGFSALYWPHCE
jgi:hypothetical protein